MTRTDSRHGAILFEVMIGLLLLAIAGTGWLTMMRQTVHAVQDIRLRERDYAAASDDLEHVRLWTAPQFAAHEGTMRVGSFVMQIEELTPTLFSATMKDTLGATLLTTSVYALASGDSSAP